MLDFVHPRYFQLDSLNNKNHVLKQMDVLDLCCLGSFHRNSKVPPTDPPALPACLVDVLVCVVLFVF